MTDTRALPNILRRCVVAAKLLGGHRPAVMLEGRPLSVLHFNDSDISAEDR